VAIVAARSLYIRDHPDTKMEDLVIYTTTQTHSLGSKAGLVLGIQVRAIEVSHDDQLALRGEALHNALEEDIKIGLKPFILSKLFFTHRGSFRLITFILTSCDCWNHLIRCGRQHVRDKGSWYERLQFCTFTFFYIHSSVKFYPWLWVHVDAAWAGSALSCPEFRDKLYLKEINAFANSFCTNFHKVYCYLLYY
jgi:aromatic-L-amino-acid decarboxylase